MHLVDKVINAHNVMQSRWIIDYHHTELSVLQLLNVLFLAIIIIICCIPIEQS